jgi:acyl-CoA thioesterase
VGVACCEHATDGTTTNVVTDLEAWLGLAPGASPLQRTWTVPARTCAGNGRLFGGSALAAAILTGEQISRRRVKSIASQYLRPIKVGQKLLLNVSVERVGRTHSHVGVRLVDETGDPRFMAVLLLTGSAGQPIKAAEPTSSILPIDAPERSYRYISPQSIQGEIDVRVACVSEPDRIDLWVRMLEVPNDTAGVVGLLADHLAFAVDRLLGPEGPAATISSSLSFGVSRVTDWIHLTLHVSSFGGEYCHGCVTAASADGTLIATGTQLLRISAPES